MKTRWLMGVLAAAALVAWAPAPAAAEKKPDQGKVVREVRRVSPTETDIVYHDTRPQAARPSRKKTPDFKEYDLAPRAPAAAPAAPAPPAPAYAPPPPGYAPQYVYPSGETFSQTYAPGPNASMAAGAGRTGGSTTLALSPPYYGGFYGGYPFYAGGGIIGPGPVVVNTYQFPYATYNPFLAAPYLSPYPTPPVATPYGIRPTITVYPPPVIIRIP